MKKTTKLLCCLLAAALCAAPIAAEEEETPRGYASYGTPTVDGTVDDIWSSTETYPIALVKDGTDEGITSTWKALWDENNLYFLIEVKGDNDHYFNGNQSTGDGIELYFDALNNDPVDFSSDDGVIQIGVRGDDTSDAAYDGTDEAKANILDNYNIVSIEHDDGFTYEVSVALSKFCSDFKFVAGAVLGLEIQVNSQADGTGRTSAYGWVDEDNICWEYPMCFGDLELLAAPVAEPETEPVTEAVIEETVAETEAVVEPAEEAEETVETIAAAPATFDIGVIAAVTGIISAAGYMLSKKH